MKALVGAFNQEKALIGAFSVIVKTGCGTDVALHSTNADPPEELLDDDLADEARAPRDEDGPVPVEALHGGHGAGRVSSWSHRRLALEMLPRHQPLHPGKPCL